MSLAAALLGTGQANAEQQVTIETLEKLVAAFNAHDLEQRRG